MKKVLLVLVAAVCLVAVGLRLSKTGARQAVTVGLLDSAQPLPEGGGARTALQRAAVPVYPAALAPGMNSIRLVAPPIIDGHSGDWPFGNTLDLSRATAFSFAGKIDSPADLSAAIRSGWDDEWLYFLIEVTDDKIVADSTDVWRDDGEANHGARHSGSGD